MWRFILAIFLVVHGLIHLGYVSPAPAPSAAGPPWPFALERSWLLQRLGASRQFTVASGRVLVAASVAGFILASLGLLLAAGWWVPVAVGASAASAVLLLVWFHRWLPVGVAIDVVLMSVLAFGLWPELTTLAAH